MKFQCFDFHFDRPIDNVKLEQWLRNLTWTPKSVAQWQEFYNEAQRSIMYDRGSSMEFNILPTIPKYEDLQVETCNRKEIQHSNDQSCHESNDSVTCQHTLFLFAFFFFVFKIIFL